MRVSRASNAFEATTETPTPTPADSMQDSRTDFIDATQEAMASQSFISLVLSSPVQKGNAQPRKQSVRPVVIRGLPMFQWELQFEKQQTHLNLDATKSIERLHTLFVTEYRDASLFTSTADLIARSNSQGVRLRRQPASRLQQTPSTAHNQQKDYLIPEGVPCPFLIELDVMTKTGQVKQARQKKFRQLNRYLELVNDVYSHLPDTGPLKVVDFGCGLSYLTFALYHLLTVVHRREVKMVGIDQNEHVIQRCREIASRLGLQGIEFSSSRIESTGAAAELDLAVSLHACDTATDHALSYAVTARTKVILAAPCCQHELYTRIDSPAITGILQHGILKERLSALATDALRGCALEAVGYRTQILEFIDLEHTPKNLLLRAVRKPSPDEFSQRKTQEYQELKRFLGVNSLATDAILEAARGE
ncbi:class I SAM-dependent methyltransferase [Planctomicrobium sp. SH661]|uniref:class I SAM-dependent methyltransferase n=1 Tax=Planctomicrobium sp. SH661 TaxID=3448124 RepID=UPI003F5BC556